MWHFIWFDNVCISDPESYVREGPSLTGLFCVCLFQLMRGGDRIKKPLKAGRHLPTSKKPFKWSFAGGLMMAPTFNAGLVAL